MAETAEARLKRMAMRSWRRGTKEMDLVLGPYADQTLAQMSPERLDLYDALLLENDQDLMQWILGQAPGPDALLPVLKEISAFARNRMRQV